MHRNDTGTSHHDYCLLQLDALKFSLKVHLHERPQPNFNFFNENTQIFERNRKVHLSNWLETNYHNISTYVRYRVLTVPEWNSQKHIRWYRKSFVYFVFKNQDAKKVITKHDCVFRVEKKIILQLIWFEGYDDESMIRFKKLIIDENFE